MLHSVPQAGDYVRLVRQSDAHTTGRRHVAVGTQGRVIATRELTPGVPEALVKFAGFVSPRSTPVVDLVLTRFLITEAHLPELSRRLHGLMTGRSRPTQTEILINIRAFLQEG